MHRFRENDPLERLSPRVVKHYREYKLDLQTDFHSRCGYCNSLDVWTGGRRFSQLDHFIPRKYLKAISVNEYSNLIYSCFYCNNSKRAKWPSKDETIAVLNNEGFVHPRDRNYNNHLQRDSKGQIFAMTPEGEYMIKALKLSLKRHAIIWNLERIDRLMAAIEPEMMKAGDLIPEAITQAFAKLSMEYHEYRKALEKEDR